MNSRLKLLWVDTITVECWPAWQHQHQRASVPVCDICDQDQWRPDYTFVTDTNTSQSPTTMHPSLSVTKIRFQTTLRISDSQNDFLDEDQWSNTVFQPYCCYLSTQCQWVLCHSALHVPSSGTPLLSRPSTKTDFATHGFRHSAPAVWNSLPRTVLDSPSLTVFKSRLKTHLFHLANTD